MQATQLWALWQALLAPFADCFTRPGFRRFTEWVTGLALSRDDQLLLSGDDGGQVLVWDRAAGTELRRWQVDELGPDFLSSLSKATR